MSNRKDITHREFEMYLKVKEFIERNGYEEADLRKIVSTPLMIHSDDMEPKRYECLSDTAKDIKALKQTLIYACKNKRHLITRRKGGAKVFYIEWLEP